MGNKGERQQLRKKEAAKSKSDKQKSSSNGSRSSSNASGINSSSSSSGSSRRSNNGNNTQGAVAEAAPAATAITATSATPTTVSSNADATYGSVDSSQPSEIGLFSKNGTCSSNKVQSVGGIFGEDGRVSVGNRAYGKRSDATPTPPTSTTPTTDEDDVSAAIEATEMMDPEANIHNPLLYLATDELAAFNPYDHPHAHLQEHPKGLAARADGEKRHENGIDIRSPLAQKAGGEKGGFYWTFRGRSPKFTRFGVLMLITLLPFGAHFVKSCFSSLEIYFLEDPDLHFNETKYGSVMSAISVPNLFMPFFGGLFLDVKGHKQGIVLFLAIELVGHVFFTLAMGWNSFWLAVVGEVLHGLGSGTVMVAMRAAVSMFFLENELTFALGVTVAGACVSKTLAKASVAPIAETRWGYMGALWYVGFWQLLSLVAGIIYTGSAKSARTRVGMELEEVEHKDLRLGSLLVALKRSTLSFWLVAVLHTLFLTAYHLFSNYSGHFLFENYEVSPVVAGYISALMPLVVVFCAPIAGLFLDRWGRKLYVLLLANVVTIFAYVMLLQERASAVVCILMLALCESFVPTILLSALPLTVDPCVYGAAFGMAEVMSAIANILSNVFFGFSRDRTASYKQGLVSLVVLCFVCLAITLFLTFWDARRGRSLLNSRGRKQEEGFSALPERAVV